MGVVCGRRSFMGSFAQKRDANQQTTSARSAEPGKENLKGSPDLNPMLHLQRAIGNQGVGRLLNGNSALTSSTGPMIKLPSRGMAHPVADLLAQPGVRFRVPMYDRIKAAYTDKDLKIPEAVIKARVTQLLERMEKEGRLKSKESVAAIVAKIFPAPGKMDQAEFEKAIDVTDRTKIYQSASEANTKVRDVDKPKLQAAMKEAATLVGTVEGDAAGLKQVFGSKDAEAKTNYQGARKVLEDLPKKLDAHVTTDYNLDDPEVGLGGWASHGKKKMHLLLKVAQVAKVEETKATVIHEATHFANASVTDHRYYSDPGYFELDEDKKVNNAAHYEELPRRVMKVSKFDTKTFTPGVKVGGGAMTREDKIKEAVGLYMRMAWDAGVDAYTVIREVRRHYENGNDKPFKKHEALILKISKLMDLTIHHQAPGKRIVTTLDVALAESVSRGVKMVRSLAKTLPVPPMGAFTDIELRDQIIAEAVKKYGNLLKDAKKDKDLLDWLEANYGGLPDML